MLKVASSNGLMLQPGIHLPTGCTGRVLSPPKERPFIVQWAFDYSGWDYFLCQIDELLCSLLVSSSLITPSSESLLSRVFDILSLFDELFRQDPTLLFVIQHHYCQRRLSFSFTTTRNGHHDSNAGYLSELLSSSSLLARIGSFLGALPLTPISTPDLDNWPKLFFTKCLSILDSLARVVPTSVWKHLEFALSSLRETISVHHSSLVSFEGSRPPSEKKQSQPSCSPRLLRSIFLELECPSGDYSATIAFLHLSGTLLSSLNQQSSSNFQEFSPLLSFILSDIWAVYSQWTFADPSKAWVLATNCLRLFDCILVPGDSDLFSSSNYFLDSEDQTGLNQNGSLEPGSNIRNTDSRGVLSSKLLDCFLNQAGAFEPLLRIILAGESTLDRSYHSGRRQDEIVFEDLLLTSCRVLHRVLSLHASTLSFVHLVPASPLESSLFVVRNSERNPEYPLPDKDSEADQRQAVIFSLFHLLFDRPNKKMEYVLVSLQILVSLVRLGRCHPPLSSGTLHAGVFRRGPQLRTRLALLLSQSKEATKAESPLPSSPQGRVRSRIRLSIIFLLSEAVASPRGVTEFLLPSSGPKPPSEPKPPLKGILKDPLKPPTSHPHTEQTAEVDTKDESFSLIVALKGLFDVLLPESSLRGRESTHAELILALLQFLSRLWDNVSQHPQLVAYLRPTCIPAVIESLKIVSSDDSRPTSSHHSTSPIQKANYAAVLRILSSEMLSSLLALPATQDQSKPDPSTADSIVNVSPHSSFGS